MPERTGIRRLAPAILARHTGGAVVMGNRFARRANLLRALFAALLLATVAACARPHAPETSDAASSAISSAATEDTTLVIAASAKPEFVEFYSTL
jgi:hypothetical protein